MSEINYKGGVGNSIELDYSQHYLRANIQIDWGEVINLMRDLIDDPNGLQSLRYFDDEIEEIRQALNYLVEPEEEKKNV